MTLSLIHYSHLARPELSQCWPSSAVHNDVVQLAGIENTARRNWAFPLRGVNNFPFDCSLPLSRFNQSISIEDYDASFDMSWGDIADLQAVKLIKLAKKQNKKIMLAWSGGVDSTVILIALLKHLRPEDRQHLVISMTPTSILESSVIYFQHIHGKFETVHFDQFVRDCTLEIYQQYIHVNGDPADQLCVGINSSSGLLLQDTSWGTRSFKDTRYFLEFLSQTFTPDIAQWLMPKLIENIESVPVPIVSCYQAAWWLAFNYFFGGSFCATWCHTWWRKDMSFDTWLDNQYLWFSQPQYQKWAMKNCDRFDLLFGPDINQWKWMSKQYISDYIKDPYWQKYKTKMASNNRRTQKSTPEWVALNGNRLLTIEKDLQELQQLLPQSLAGFTAS